MKSAISIVTFVASLALIINCGGKEGTSVDLSRNLSGQMTNNSSGDMVQVNFSAINRDNPQGLSLASADAYSFSISGCISGYQTTGDETTTTINVQDGDVNCLLSLSSLTVSGVTYDLSGISTWTGGSMFSVTSGSDELFVVVAQQLPGTIDAASPPTVTISYGGLNVGSSGSISAGVGSTLSVGGDTIDLDLVSSSAIVDGATGNGLFTFTLDCIENIAGSACRGVDLTTLVVGLDLNTGAADLDLATCRGYAEAEGSLLNVGADGTLSSTTVQLTGPGQMFAPENADLVLTVFDSTSQSCKYFKILVTP